MILKQTEIISISSTDQSTIVMVKHCVFIEVRTEFLNIIYMTIGCNKKLVINYDLDYKRIVICTKSADLKIL
jgi:hypothetical protein